MTRWSVRASTPGNSHCAPTPSPKSHRYGGAGQAGRLRPQQDAELMTQGEVLGHDCRPGSKEGGQRPEEQSNQADHGGRIATDKKPEERLRSDGIPAG